MLRARVAATGGRGAPPPAGRSNSTARCSEACQFEGMVGRSPQMLEVFARIRRAAPHFRTALITRRHRHRQGTGGARAAPAEPRLGRPHGGVQLLGDRRDAVRKRAVRLREGRLHRRRTRTRSGCSSTPAAARCFWTRSGTCRWRRRASCCACSRTSEFQRVGSPVTRKIDVRVVAATNRDLRDHDGQGPVPRRPLLPALHGGDQVPRLADRKEDLPLLERYFVERFAAQYGKPFAGSRRAPRSCWRATAGRATCANWRTSSATPA